MACSTPSVLIVPGSFSSGEFYYPLRDAIMAQGFEAKAINLPTVKINPNDTRTPPPMYADADLVAAEVEKLADEGKDVIVVAHSYGGVPMTQGAAGLGKATRAKEGKKGGITTLAYMTAFLPELGQAAIEILSDVPPGQAIQVGDDNGWWYHLNRTAAVDLVFNDLPREEALEWSTRFGNHSAQSFLDPTTQLGYLEEDVAISYLFCEHDRTIPPTHQQRSIDIAERQGKTVAVTRIAADHAPMLSAFDEVVGWIVGIARG
ncbi:Alpha/beta hydrolase fold-1 [Stachybotrys elegans]|uniref:Alpha/beta hydrolase fold-1 n=1 Tax=Stachybotrys elegans TaxID=80388 RepID=A0A8K0WMX1_9HYPO|nr:Alpha/beta hydrolase fold-1 [Stachybotrys elegans]